LAQKPNALVIATTDTKALNLIIAQVVGIRPWASDAP
jgi:hypothetical protein